MGLSPARLALVGLLLGGGLAIRPRPATAADDAVEASPARRFDHLDRQIRDGALPREAARQALRRLWPELAAQRRAASCPASPRAEWVFPVAGYGPSAIGGRRGSGYRPGGYDYFAGNRHGGHPAHDIFIRDRDRDERDDRTGAPVAVRSMSGGLVVAVNPEWSPGSPLRGGIYVWVYDPTSDGLFYYAHLGRAAVRPGDCVAPGARLGEVGRTGKNAAPRRSPTHLHFAHLVVVDGQPTPRNPYDDLRRARREPVPTTAPAAPAAPFPWLAGPPAPPLAARIAPPPGYRRAPAPAGSFAAWLRALPLKPGTPPVHLYTGALKANQTAHAAVFDVDTGPRDLQQCADAVIRLRAEYLFARGRRDAIHFRFTSGAEAPWTRWAAGERPVVTGRTVRWVRRARPSVTYATFRDYLTTVFRYAGTYSLRRELDPVARPRDLRPGDVFIQGGFPGHAVLVVDVAVPASGGPPVFLLAQSFMPAQEIHLLRNPGDPRLSPWYRADFGPELVTPEWTFRAEDLRRFRE